jgi:protein phosphatase
MAPSDTCRDGEYLEHPRETFEYFRREGVSSVVCQEKHMGSRAVAIVCRDAEVARRRFGVAGDEAGVVTTRTGRPFFPNAAEGREVVARIGAAMDRSGLWERLETDWICLDAEIMPWSAKAQELLRTQYAPTGTAAVAAHAAAIAALTASVARGDGSDEVLERFRLRQECVSRFADVYRHYCWRVDRVTDLRIAPFHLLATEGRTYFDRDHMWHMELLGELCAGDPEIVRATPYRRVDIDDPSSEQAAIDWWGDLTGKGGEGMVVKPLDWIVRGKRGLVQPAVKCRGREYLRIIYGPEYTAPENLDRLRPRGLSVKRGLALREFALGLESLHRFVEEVPLYRVHECVFAVLALESEPVDPRL